MKSAKFLGRSGSRSSHSSRIWAITSYFAFDDPPGIKRRLKVYREFHRHLGVPLAAFELSLDGHFDLMPSDADILLQSSDGDLMWQKERLLNCVLEVLPPECDAVAWIDCDMVLQRPDWAEATREALRKVPLLQPFSRCLYLATDTLENGSVSAPVLASRESAARMYCTGRLPDYYYQIAGSSLRAGCCPGGAWAATREFLETHHHYDSDILGAGDKLMFSAACCRHHDTADSYRMTAARRDHYMAWAQSLADAVRGNIGFLEGDIYHLWHGELERRQYGARFEGFDALGFEPDRDLVKTPSGAWRWNSDKPELHDFVWRHFAHRREGMAKPPKADHDDSDAESSQLA